jgi:hypothetical protein
MPHHETTTLSGVIQYVFAHRFTVQSDGTVYLADLGPKGVEQFPLDPGLTVTLTGEVRPSEIKVREISAAGRELIRLEHKKPHHGPARHQPGEDADPMRALAAAREAGWTPNGAPQRKPKHFEVLARRGGGNWAELHVDFSGAIYKTRDADPVKWHIP